MASSTYDVIVIGASFGGVAAALAAADGGNLRVALLEATDWVGGQATSQGVSRWDEAKVELIETTSSTRTYRALRNQIRQWYRENATLSATGQRPDFNPGFAQTNFPFSVDPSVTHEVIERLLSAAQGLDVRLQTSVVQIDVESGSVRAIHTDAGDTFAAAVYLDATDLGDMLPLAGLRWTIGAEAQTDTNEPDAPPDAQPGWVQPITVPIAIEARPEGENHVIGKPSNYDEIVAKQNFHIVDGDINGVMQPKPGGAESIFGYRQYIDSRNFADPDFAYNRTTLNVGSNDYMDATLPSGDRGRDQQIYEGARDATLSFLYWLQTQVERDDGAGHGYPNLMVRTDAFGTADGCAPQAYIRESRRIDGEERILQQDIATALLPAGAVRANRFETSCGIGTYGIDVHPANGPGTPWQGFETLPFQIPLGALLPKQLTNFVAACKNIGATHLTSGAYRVHPVEWAIGEAAGALGAFCVRENVSPKDVWRDDDRRAAYQYELLSRGVPIFWWSDVQFEDDARAYAAIQLCGVNGVFSGEGGLAFDPSGRANQAVRDAVDENLGQSLDWPEADMTRAEAAIFVCQQMGWPIG